MPIVDALLPEFDHEMTVTRKLLERVPDDKLEWKPHPKSMTLGQLASHIAMLPRGIVDLITEPVADVPQVPLIEHPDIRRMLLAQKTKVEGAIALFVSTPRKENRGSVSITTLQVRRT